MGALTTAGVKRNKDLVRKIDLAVEFLRRGIDSPTAMAREAQKRLLIPYSVDIRNAADQMKRARESAYESGFEKLGPATIQDARGALELYAVEMLETARMARENLNFSEARAAFDSYLLAHGIRIREDVTPINIILGTSPEADKAKSDLQATLARLLGQMGPEEASQLLLLTSRLDVTPPEDSSSQAWRGDSRPVVLDVQSIPEPSSEASTGSPSTGGPGGAPSDSTHCEPPELGGSREDED